MAKWKSLRKWKKEFGPIKGRKLWLEALRAKRARTLALLKTAGHLLSMGLFK